MDTDFDFEKKKLKAALDLLGWSVDNLSAESGVSSVTIYKYLSATGPKLLSEKNHLRIFHTLNSHGIKITPDGVHRTDVITTILRGEDANKRVLDDIYQTLKEAGGEVLISGLSELRPEHKDYDFLVKHINRIRAAGISERILIERGDTNLVAPKEWYRCLPPEDFSAYPFQIYANKIAMIDWGPPQKITIVEHQRYAETFRFMFNALWRRSEPIRISNE